MLLEVAPAKINLFLHVLGRLPDGYHALESLAVFADLHDTVGVEPNRSFALKVKTPSGWCLPAEDNLVSRAAKALSDASGKPLDFSLQLEKRIPIAAGLGGGSADAAACLRLLCRYWKLNWQSAEVSEIAKALGADVPVCLHSQPAMMKGIGDVLSFVDLPTFHLVLVNPNKSVSTASIFKALNLSAGQTLNKGAPLTLPAVLTLESVFELMQSTRNDLQPAACALESSISDCLKTLLKGADDSARVRMTGSGATCFALVETLEKAQFIEGRVRDQLPGAWVWSGSLYSR